MEIKKNWESKNTLELAKELSLKLKPTDTLLKKCSRGDGKA